MELVELLDLFIFLLVGVGAGYLANRIVNGSGKRLFINLIIGVAGSFLGGFLLKNSSLFLCDCIVLKIFSATVGAIILLWLISLIKKR